MPTHYKQIALRLEYALQGKIEAGYQGEPFEGEPFEQRISQFVVTDHPNSQPGQLVLVVQAQTDAGYPVSRLKDVVKLDSDTDLRLHALRATIKITFKLAHPERFGKAVVAYYPVYPANGNPIDTLDVADFPDWKFLVKCVEQPGKAPKYLLISRKTVGGGNDVDCQSLQCDPPRSRDELLLCVYNTCP